MVIMVLPRGTYEYALDSRGDIVYLSKQKRPESRRKPLPGFEKIVVRKRALVELK